MATKRTKKRTKRTASVTVSKARNVLNEQKKDWQRIFKAEVKNSGNPIEGAKRAGEIYRKKYGATAKSRWKNALSEAKSRLF